MPVHRIADLISLLNQHRALPRSSNAPGMEWKILKALADKETSAEDLADSLDSNAATVRTNLSRLKANLDKFFDKTIAGQECVERLDVAQEGRGTVGRQQPYILKLKRNKHPVAQFWAPHRGTKQTLLVWTEPLVFYDRKNRCYIRYLDLNADSADRRKIAALVPAGHPASGLVACFGYQSSGDVAAVYHLEQRLKALAIDTKRALTRQSNEEEVYMSNSVVIGNYRMNPYVALLQDGFDIKVQERSVTIARPVSEEEAEPHVDYEPVEEPEKHNNAAAYVVVTRRPNLHFRSTVTMIAGNHGRAIEKTAEFLTSEDELEDLWTKRLGAGHGNWPDRFQILFKIPVSRDLPGVVYQDARPIAFRAYREG